MAAYLMPLVVSTQWVQGQAWTQVPTQVQAWRQPASAAQAQKQDWAMVSSQGALWAQSSSFFGQPWSQAPAYGQLWAQSAPARGQQPVWTAQQPQQQPQAQAWGQSQAWGQPTASYWGQQASPWGQSSMWEQPTNWGQPIGQQMQGASMFYQTKNPWFALKVNLVYGGYTFTPNLSAEIGIGPRSTLDIGGGYNPWNLDGTTDDNKKLVHWLGMAEYRYWFCERYNGHYFGAHVLGSQYNISMHELPMLFGKGSKNYRFEGWAAGAGISYGYQFILSPSWNLEVNVGAGYVYLDYDKFECNKCGDPLGSARRDYLGPTKAGISLVYIF
jgi:hypothetical protein